MCNCTTFQTLVLSSCSCSFANFFARIFWQFRKNPYLCNVKTKNLYINILESIWHALAFPMHNLLAISILPPNRTEV